MYKIFAGILAVVALSAAIIVSERSVPPTQAGPSDQGAGVGQPVIDALRNRASVEVDVALRAPDAIAGGPAFSIDSLKAEVAELRDGVLNGLTPHDFRLDRQFNTIAAFTGTISQAGLTKLAAHPDVVRIDLPAAGSAHLAQMLPLIGADDMHTLGYTGAGVTVAVVDSGLDTDHADLGNDLVGEECFNQCDNATDRQSGAGAAEDDHGHGTNVTGIITSTGTVSSLGIAPDADIFAYKVLNSSNGFASLTGNVIPALDDIIANHPEIDLVNMSLGTFALYSGNCDASPASNVIAAAAINTLRSIGVTTFVSAGNSGSGTSMGSPACVANSISVGAVYDADIGTYNFFCTDTTTAADQVTCFSNSNSTTDIFGPGCAATSTGLANGTSTFCGTSQASPASAACAALLLEQDSSLTPAQIESRLETSPVSVTDVTNGLSFPRIDCSVPEPTPTPTPTATPTATPTKQPDPGDTDGDGCSDQRENGPDETLGGLRDYKNPHDFYDVLGPGAALPKDKIIDLPNDILGVIQHFAPLGTEPVYDVNFDRGPSSGPNPWNMTAPDGVIDLPNDILGVILQFGHSCV